MGLHEEYLKLIKRYGFEFDKQMPSEEKIQEMRNLRRLHLSEYSLNPVVLDAIDKYDSMKPLHDMAQYEVWNRLLEAQQKYIEGWLTRLSFDIPENILVAHFPTGNFNAQVRLSDSGILILVNTGLMLLIHKFIKIMHWEHNNKWSRDITEQHLKQTAIDYILHNDAQKAATLPPIPHPHHIPAGDFLNWVERFVLLHEYAHILHGHLDLTVTRVVETAVGSMEVVKKDWEQEFMADMGAAVILMGIYNDKKRDIPLHDSQYSDYLATYSNILAGPLFFFEIDRLVTDLIASMVGKFDTGLDSIDHPPPYMRSHMMWNYFKDNLTSEEQDYVTIYPQWLLSRIKGIFSIKE